MNLLLYRGGLATGDVEDGVHLCMHRDGLAVAAGVYLVVVGSLVVVSCGEDLSALYDDRAQGEYHRRLAESLVYIDNERQDRTLEAASAH